MGTKLTSVMKPPDVDIPHTLRWATHNFNVDRIAAEVITAFNAASIQSMVLKGAAIATWLYAGDRPRLYEDTDLLIRKNDWRKAMEILEANHFEDGLARLAHPRMEAGDGYPWVRYSDGADIDLHYTLFGVGTDPDVVWAAFSEGALQESLGGIEVSMPSYPARLFHIALHAIQHGGAAREKPMTDLRLAIAKVPSPTWLKALQLAERLDAVETFASGLQLTPEGEGLAREIGANRSGSARAVLRLEGVPMAEGFKELFEARGIRTKSRILVRELFPNPAFMRWWTPLARRGIPGLMLAYGWRPVWLGYHAIPGYRAWRRAARRSR